MMTHLQFDQLLQDVISEDHLPERQWVWVLESRIPGRLCVRNINLAKKSYIIACVTEADATDILLHGEWAEDSMRYGARTIEMSVESVLIQASEQGPSLMGFPCGGIRYEPVGEIIEVAGNPDKGFI